MAAPGLPLSLADNPRLDRWIAFEDDGRVRVATGKVEIGQGIVTALTQIAAEELDVPPERIRMVSGETDISPAEGFTSGSYSIAIGGAALRLVCAEVRAMFLHHVARILNCPTAELTVEEGRFLQRGDETGQDYWSLASDIDLARNASGTARTKHPKDYRIVGTPMRRIDLEAKLKGGAYIHDIAPDNVLHARVLRRPWRGARLASFDEAAIRRAAPAPIEIIRDGDFIAFTADQEIAVMRAAAAARERAIWEGGTRLSPDMDKPERLMAQESRDRVVEKGQGRAHGNRVVEATYARPFLTYASIGPSCALAEYKEGALKVWSHSQGVAVLRDWLARTLGLEAGRVTVHHRHGAGAYGHNTADDAAFDAAFIAMKVPGRTVRVQLSREDEFTSAPISPAMAIRMRAVLDDEGRPADWTSELWSPVHAQRPGMNGQSNFFSAEALPGAPPPLAEPNDVPDERGGGATRNAYPLYDLPHHRLIHHKLVGLPLRTSSLRGLGAFANVFAIESFIDELAEAAGADPVRYRLALTSDPRARQVIETAAEMGGWFGREETGGGRARGFGFARYKNIAGYMAAVVEVEVAEEVRLLRVWACVDAGLVINPDGAASQIEGGIVQAASFCLKEQVRFADGKVATASWDDYPILRFTEVPEIEVKLIAAPHEPALGLGEVAMGPTVAAIGNAVARALGTRIRELPLTRERIMATLLAS
jgi:nicotinate dehydrogenase subunit B